MSCDVKVWDGWCIFLWRFVMSLVNTRMCIDCAFVLTAFVYSFTPQTHTTVCWRIFLDNRALVITVSCKRDPSLRSLEVRALNRFHLLYLFRFKSEKYSFVWPHFLMITHKKKFMNKRNKRGFKMMQICFFFVFHIN